MPAQRDERFDPAPLAERRTVLGEGNLLRVSTVVGIVALILGGFISFQSLRDEIRTKTDETKAAAISSTIELQRAISELRYDINTRTANVVPRADVLLWIERLARKNPSIDIPPFP